MKHWKLGLLSLLLSACATTAPVSGERDPRDPYENFNRAMFEFTEKVDETAVKPIAQAYKAVTPSFVQTGIGNFFGNIGDIWSAINNLLQGKLEAGMNDVMRVALNTTWGFGGVLDIGSAAGLPKHKEDFGQTLGVWGVPSGPYLFLPLLGPSTMRDAIVLPIDYYGDAWAYRYPVYQRNTGSVVRAIDKRAASLDAVNLLEEAALDKYLFVRDAYLQKRANDISKKEDE